jgi:hypothetical protein
MAKSIKELKVKLSPEERREKNFKANESTLKKYGLPYTINKSSIDFIHENISYRIGMNVGKILMFDEETKKIQVGANIWQFIAHHELKPLEMKDDVFDFGKYFGVKIKVVMNIDNQYVMWAYKNNEKFKEKFDKLTVEKLFFKQDI